MGEITGWFYLHINNSLIWKNSPDAIIDIRESDFCISAWAFDNNRKTAWNILVEALSIGANRKRILDLASKWNCNDSDAINYAESIGVLLGQDGDQLTATRTDFTNLQESPCGFGDSYLEAMADLCKQLGYEGGKLGWHITFEDLLKT